MKIHEYQAKALLRQYGIPVPDGKVANSVAQARDAARVLGGDEWIIKAQVHAGGRGKAGGVHRVSGVEDLESVVDRLLGRKLVTSQTSADGQPVHSVLIEQPVAAERELYFAMLVDRASERVICMGSQVGGTDIEVLAEEQPGSIKTVTADPVAGLLPFNCRQLGFQLELDESVLRQLCQLMSCGYELLCDRDLLLIEVNPLVITTDNKLVAVDAKITIDDNAIYRQEELAQLRDVNQENEVENQAEAHGLSYVSLAGDIGCMVNGAGLAMATMDLIKLHGGEPANFLDVGGGTNIDKVAEAFRLIVQDKKVSAILINIFGGIVQCDLIAEGILKAANEVAIDLPIIVRLKGTHMQEGRDLLSGSSLNVHIAADLDDAARMAVNAAKGKS
jgi:succinyl-CoA synthetase beta subunit